MLHVQCTYANMLGEREGGRLGRKDNKALTQGEMIRVCMYAWIHVNSSIRCVRGALLYAERCVFATTRYKITTSKGGQYLIISIWTNYS